MPHVPPTPSGQTGSEDAVSLTDRVAARVIDARLAIERRTSQTMNDAASAGEQQETESLRRVFRDMGVSYRRYRSQTGGPVVPGLRDAAYKFRADPSLTSLVAVAAYLDKLDLLS
jgi:hypothetical protein